MIELSFPVPTASMNRWYGHHWSKKAAERKKWGWLVRVERLRIGTIPLAKPGPRQMTVDRWGPKLLDWENFVAGTKQMTDALVAEGFLVDDSPQHMVATYRQHVGKPYRTEVRIE